MTVSLFFSKRDLRTERFWIESFLYKRSPYKQLDYGEVKFDKNVNYFIG